MNAPAARGGRPAPVVLVVEDNAAYLLQLQKVFRVQGMTVVQADDGMSGLESAFQELPDAVVADVEMPALSGFVLSRLLKSNPLTAEIPVILLHEGTEQCIPSWYAQAHADHLMGKFDDTAALVQTAWTEILQRDYPGGRARAARATGTLGRASGAAVVERLVVHDLIRTEVAKLVRFTTVGNRYQMARAMFDVLAAIVEYRAAGVFFVQPNYSTFFLHTLHTLPSDHLNGLLSHAVAPLRGLLSGTIRLALFSGDEQTPRELGRWTPQTGTLHADLPIVAHPLQSEGQLLGSIALIPANPSAEPAAMLGDFAEQFATVLTGLYLFEGCLLLQRELAVAKGAGTPSPEPSEADVLTMVGRLLQGHYGLPSAAQRQALEAALAAGEHRRVAHQPPIPHQPAPEVPAKEPTDLLKLVREVCTAVQPSMQQKRLRFEARIPAAAPTMRLQRAGIAIALTNLLMNAITYTPQGGSVTLWVIVEEQQIRIAVKDTGAGIDPARQQDLFQTRGGAERTGLATSREIAEMHGGTIIVDSAPGKGSLFVLSIPLPGAEPTVHQGTREGAA